MIWNLKELRETVNTIAGNKQIKDLFQDEDYEAVWFYFYDQKKQVKYVSHTSDIYKWDVYALLKAGHVYVLTNGNQQSFVYCYANVDSPNSAYASYRETLISLDVPQSFDSPVGIFGDSEKVISPYTMDKIDKIEDKGESNLAKDLTTLACLYKSTQENFSETKKTHFNPKHELLGRYEGYHYNHIDIEEDSIKIVLSGKDCVKLSVQDYLIALAETEGLKQLDLAFKNYNINYKLEINK